MPKTYADEYKRQLVAKYEAGKNISEICQETEIAQSTLYRWVKDYKTISSPSGSYTPHEMDSLRRRLKKAEHQLDIIRLTKLIENVPLTNKLTILAEIYESNKEYSVHELCEALNVARGTFYNHIFRKADRSKYLQEQQELMRQVQQVFDESHQRFGAEKIRIVLREHGVVTSKRRITEIMKELDLHSMRTDAKRQYQKQQEQVKKNLVNQKFTVKGMNQIWVSDITYFKINYYNVCLCVIIDLFSRRVIAHRIGKSASKQLVSSTFKAAYQNRGNPKDLVFHSDRGSTYIANSFCKMLKQLGIKQSFSATGKPHDNAVAETFFATFKKEEAYRRNYKSELEFIKSVDEYISFYNKMRPHRTLAYKTPAKFEELYG